MRRLRISLQSKLYLAFLVTILLPALFVTLFSYARSSRLLEDQSLAWQVNALNQADDSLSFRIDTITNLYNSILSHTTMWRIINDGTKNTSLSQVLRDISEMEKLTSSMESNSQIVKMRIYLDTSVYQVENSTISSLSRFREGELFRRIKESGERIYFTESYPRVNYYGQEEAVVSSFVAVRSLQNLNEYAMVIELIIKATYFTDMLNSLSGEIGGGAFLVDHSNSVMLKSESADAESLEIVLENWDNPMDDWQTLEYKGNIYYLSRRPIASTDRTLFFVLPEIALTRRNMQLRQEVLVIALVCVGLLAGIILPLSKVITTRLGTLRDAMRSVQGGKLNVNLHMGGNDEISDLAGDFIFMLERINTLLKEKNITLEKLRTQELNALHSQINPHFLCNSLDLLNWMAFERGAAEIQEAVDSLARFYRISLSKGEVLIPLRDELAHVTMYTNIQNMRYDNSVLFILNVPENLQDCYIPKITLQPIVENAFVHGIMCKDSKNGTIVITGWLDSAAGALHVLVEDDGPGFQHGASPLNNEEAHEHGYGLNNVNDRLRMYFGRDSGISFPSRGGKPGAGVLVTLLAVRDREEVMRLSNSQPESGHGAS